MQSEGLFVIINVTYGYFFLRRSYYYDTDIGLYYLQSRYYDPEIGRFINADCYASTGQGIIGCNMYAYCLNNPASQKDISGAISVCASAFGSSPFLPGYASADEAAMAFATETYSATSYVLHEYSTEIYLTEYYGVERYDYTKPAVGAPHQAKGINMNRVDNIVAYAHTHPNSDSFSDKDIIWANKYCVDAYLVCPNKQVLCYDHCTATIEPIEIVHPRPLTFGEKISLVAGLTDSWNWHCDDHVKEGHSNSRCIKISWPND